MAFNRFVNALNKAKTAATSAVAAAADKAKEAAEMAKEAAEKARETATAAAEKARETASGAADRARDSAAVNADKARESALSFVERAREKVREAASAAAQKAQDAVTDVSRVVTERITGDSEQARAAQAEIDAGLAELKADISNSYRALDRMGNEQMMSLWALNDFFDVCKAVHNMPDLLSEASYEARKAAAAAAAQHAAAAAAAQQADAHQAASAASARPAHVAASQAAPGEGASTADGAADNTGAAPEGAAAGTDSAVPVDAAPAADAAQSAHDGAPAHSSAVPADAAPAAAPAADAAQSAHDGAPAHSSDVPVSEAGNAQTDAPAAAQLQAGDGADASAAGAAASSADCGQGAAGGAAGDGADYEDSLNVRTFTLDDLRNSVRQTALVATALGNDAAAAAGLANIAQACGKARTGRHIEQLLFVRDIGMCGAPGIEHLCGGAVTVLLCLKVSSWGRKVSEDLELYKNILERARVTAMGTASACDEVHQMFSNINASFKVLVSMLESQVASVMGFKGYADWSELPEQTRADFKTAVVLAGCIYDMMTLQLILSDSSINETRRINEVNNTGLFQFRADYEGARSCLASSGLDERLAAAAAASSSAGTVSLRTSRDQLITAGMRIKSAFDETAAALCALGRAELDAMIKTARLYPLVTDFLRDTGLRAKARRSETINDIYKSMNLDKAICVGTVGLNVIHRFQGSDLKDKGEFGRMISDVIDFYSNGYEGRLAACGASGVGYKDFTSRSSSWLSTFKRGDSSERAAWQMVAGSGLTIQDLAGDHWKTAMRAALLPEEFALRGEDPSQVLFNETRFICDLFAEVRNIAAMHHESLMTALEEYEQELSSFTEELEKFRTELSSSDGAIEETDSDNLSSRFRSIVMDAARVDNVCAAAIVEDFGSSEGVVFNYRSLYHNMAVDWSYGEPEHLNSSYGKYHARIAAYRDDYI